MEGKTCLSCERPAEWQVAAATTCCWKYEYYCRACARVQWLSSGLFGRRCHEHNTLSQLTYHPRKIDGTGECKVCGAGCTVWRTP